MASTLCDDCKASGMAILPVRYAVVPKGLTPALPGWTGGDRIKSIPTGSDFHYALRTLRAGFVYIFYSKNAFGANQWETYAITQDGLLIKQPTPAMAQAVALISCSRQGHSDARLRHIVVQRPEKCGPTWIAYSEQAWSDETIQAYTNDTKLRNARMQTIHPSTMATGSKHNHGATADVAALEGVLEYASGLDTSKLPHDSAATIFSKEDGSFDAARLGKMSTRTPWHLRKGQAAQDLSAMQARCKKPDGGSNTPHVLALWDAIGITHELNGYRNDAAGWLKKYGDERELQLSAFSAIEGVKKALEKRVNDGWDHVAKNTANMPDLQTNSLRTQAVTRYAKDDPAALGRPLYELDEKLRAGSITLVQHQAQRTQVFNQHSSNPAAMEAAYKEIDAQRTHRDAERSSNLAKNKQQDAAQSWDRYAKKIDAQALAHFKEAWDSLLAKADAIIDRRTEVLVGWLESSLLIDTLEDFHTHNVRDGMLFEDVVGDAIFGMGSSKAGAMKIEAWVKEAKASVKGNLLWRAIALNQTEGMAEVDAALALAEQSKAQRTVASALNIEGILAKTLKVFADTHKKAAGLHSANTSAASPAGSTAFGTKVKPINTRDIDKVLSTVGDKLLEHFRVPGLADHVSEKLIQHMLSIRAMVDPKDSLALVVAQAAAEPQSRGHLLRRLAAAETFLAANTADIKTAQAENLRAAWGKFRSGDSKAPAAMRDARLAIVVMLIEGLNFQKLLAECKTKGDAKSWWSLAASGMTITSGLYDVASVPAKNLFGAESWSYQKIKLFGGMLSAGATAIGVYLDVKEVGKNAELGRRGLRNLYQFKAVLGTANLGLIAAASFTYSAPLIGRLTGSPIAAGAARAVGARAAAIIGARILFMSAGLWLTVGTFAIQVFIWVFTDDDLQYWFEHCAFGKERDKSWTPKRQVEEFFKALQAVGV
ncbi:T6SS effector BTH_I2691 family protein [uncultured Aquabacterium sp.]|uniref:T6SS effector BTH_I2691 family protein n=1 Tax=uncultured Aquabacterium sp. TaxID=158753 RepID=UPI0030D25403